MAWEGWAWFPCDLHGPPGCEGCGQANSRRNKHVLSDRTFRVPHRAGDKAGDLGSLRACQSWGHVTREGWGQGSGVAAAVARTAQPGCGAAGTAEGVWGSGQLGGRGRWDGPGLSGQSELDLQSPGHGLGPARSAASVSRSVQASPGRSPAQAFGLCLGGAQLGSPELQESERDRPGPRRSRAGVRGLRRRGLPPPHAEP